jgi:hypothetical protein
MLLPVLKRVTTISFNKDTICGKQGEGIYGIETGDRHILQDILGIMISRDNRE